MKVLITGFEPFGNSAENSSWAVAEKFADSVIDGSEIVTALLPVSFSRVAKVIRKEVGKHNPYLLIMLGQSAGIDYVKLERVALNMMDSKGGDNDGRIPCEEPIDANGMPAYFTNVPVKQLCVAVEQQGVAAKVSKLYKTEIITNYKADTSKPEGYSIAVVSYDDSRRKQAIEKCKE